MMSTSAKILIVDDQPESVEMLVLLLKNNLPEVQLLKAFSGFDALDLARRELPDLILLDVKMPGMDGYEVVRHLKANQELARIPVLMVSGAMVSARHRIRGLNEGAEGYICKPFEPLEFLAQVRTLLRLKMQGDKLRQHGSNLEADLVTSAGALRESEKNFRLLFHEQPDALFVEDEKGVVLDANAAAAALHGVEREALIGCRVTDLCPPEQREAVLRDYPRLLSGEIKDFEGFSLTADRRSVPVQIRASRIHYMGQPALLLQVRDITETKRLEAELRQAQKMEAVGRLAGGIAHDFNNLLTSILGFSHLLLDHLGPGQAGHNELQEVIRAGERAAELTRQLLAFGRKQVIQKSPLDLNTIVNEMHRMLRRTLGEDIELMCHLGTDLHTVEADMVQMSQIIMNLAVNARDAMPAGGKLTLQTSNVFLDDLYCRALVDVKSGAYVRMIVRDNGSGMTEQTRAHLFEPFFTTKAPGKGTGLGLSTVYGIVKQNGGHIEVDSAVGAGTEFRIYFPAMPSEKLSTSMRVPFLPRGTGTVLLVESENGVRELTLRVLVSLGYTVLAARDGVEAWDRYGHFPGVIALVLADIASPQTGGLELIRKLREVRDDFRVLLTSGFFDDHLSQLKNDSGRTDFLLKPYSREQLAMKVRDMLDRTGRPLGDAT